MHPNSADHARTDRAQPARTRAAALAGALCVAVAALLTAPVPAPAAPAHVVGFAEGGTLLTKSPATLDRDFAAARRLGMTWVRVEINWRIVENRRGRYDWRNVDKVVGSARRHGLSVLGLVTFAPPWAADPAGAFLPGSRPKDTAAFGRFAGIAAGRYARSISTWEVWNEPNLPLFFSPRPDTGIYGRVLRAAYPAIKAARPGATVLSAGLSVANDTAATIAPRTFVRRLYDQGLRRYFDGIALHPYTFPYTPATDPNGNWADITEVRSVMLARGDAGKKIWITEFGAPTGTAADAVSPARQAVILREAITTARRLPYVAQPFFVYTIRDTGPNAANREDNFGLLRANGSQKPAAAQVRRLTR
ncbi:hypothetical protein GII30_04265 [Gordonia amarae]|uniref:Uncharacterized protein n=2 Tax=Gordonia amarae TaxID=36821 RepID=G7GQX4_9ACTN|nr:beta-galactosidase [Gordonia amarae]MCS3877582.1 GH35 family endo-1,4-beta-xylanase [Gordonia amarae]QHN20869.1 hypothetical protein GII34_04270 [Gordonia amarae]QHN29720.1 hypothetical protein GII32_04275 [Gordonia amarae]QHN38495.1 hypothetical protein GII30_04265 [Gordonia amarae]GAB05999.1 hypothetical protein GOAMR_46_00970 [Gordonia amarae NBRC 15530]